MKTTKRFLSIMLIAIMTFCLSAFNVSAVDETYSITVDNNNSAVSINGKTFNAYKVFSLTYSGDAYTYSTDSTCLSSSGYGSYTIENLQSADQDGMQAFGNYVYENYIKGKSPTVAGTATASGETAIISVSNAGYYLVYAEADNVNGADGKDAVTSLVLCDTASPNASVNLKLDAPSLTKEIKHNELGSWGVVGDNQIGDDVEFRLITKVPSINGYSDYTYVIHDTMTTGLTFKELVNVKINDGTELASTYYEYTGNGQNLTVTVKIKEAIAAGVIEKDDMLYTYYKATLNKNALKSEARNTTQHNDNEAYLEYSNNPYDSTSKGETPHVKVYDWTFAVSIHKVGINGGNTIDLAGAGFTIKDNGTVVKFTQTSDGYVVDPSGTVTEIITPANGTFKLLGLDDSKAYILEETTVPDGYSKCENVTLNITAGYNDNGNELTTLSLTADGAKSVADMTATIENKSGTKLVGTGGIGTTIFYIAGGVLMAGAVVLLVVKRRVNK